MPVTSSSLPPASATGAATRATNSSASNKTRDVNVGDADENDPQVIKQLLITVLKDRTADGGAVAKTVTPSAGDTCTWYANKQCTVARTCYDCLNTKLAGQNPQSCMVDNFGACVSMSLYKPEKDFRRARPPNAVGSTISNQYPGVNATYCSNDDKYCALCRNTWTNPFDNSQLSYLPFCRGTGGCVCIQTCESPFHNDNVILQRCIDLSSVPSVSVYTSIGFMAALCGVIGVVTFCVRRWMNRSRALARPAAFRHDLRLPQREPSGPRLGLSGWRSMREKLIESEREQLQLNGDNHLRAVPVVDLPSSIEPVETDQGLIPLSPTPPPPSQHSAEETDVELHESDMSNPSAETDLVASPAPVVVSTRTEL